MSAVVGLPRMVLSKRQTELNDILLQESGGDYLFLTGAASCFQDDVPLSLSSLNTYQMPQGAICSYRRHPMHVSYKHCDMKQKQVQQTELTYGGLYDSKFKH